MANDSVCRFGGGCTSAAGPRGLCRKHYQAAWKADELDQYPLPEDPSEADRFICPAEHKHDRSTTCYTAHKCRCEPCRAARSSRNRKWNREREFGDPDTGLVDAAPVRAHIQMLGEHGVGYKRAATIAGISSSAVGRILYGRAREGGKLPTQIRRETAERLLAIRPTSTALSEGALFPSRGSQRRLQALVTRGWSMQRLSEKVGVSRSTFTGILEHDQITARTHRAICDTFDALWDQSAPARSPAERASVARAKRYAAERGWVPPLAWDDIDTDETPADAEADEDEAIDEVAVALAAEGRGVQLSRAELTAAIRLLHSRKLTDTKIAERLGISDRTVLRTRADLGLPGWKPAELANAA